MTLIHPHELGMAVRIRSDRPDAADYNGQVGVIDEIAIYATFARGIDFKGWDLLVGFHDGGSHAYAPFEFDEAEIVGGSAAQLIRERDGLATRAQIFEDQRDAAWAAVRVHGHAIAATADLATGAAWRFVSSYAHSLLSAAGPDWHLHYGVAEVGAGCGAKPREGVPFRASFDENDPHIDCAPCRAYLAGLRAGRNDR